MDKQPSRSGGNQESKSDIDLQQRYLLDNCALYLLQAKTTASQPIETKPAAAQPTEAKPVATQSTEAKPATTQPTEAKPVVN